MRHLPRIARKLPLAPGRGEFLQIIAEGMASGGAFVRRHVERGEPAFVDMWEQMGGQARYDRQTHWFEQHRARFVEMLG
ncbi:MAG: hypothetical protein ACYCS7_04650 [Acidimicrobiales bacterium]